MTTGETDLHDLDTLELGREAADTPDDENIAAELMARALDRNPLVKGVERADGNRITFVQPGNGPALRNFGNDYDYDVRHISSIEEADPEKLPDYDEDVDIAVMVRVRGIRPDYLGYARPDYTPGPAGATYKGDGDEPRPVTET